MEDEKILNLFFDRDERALKETAQKYEKGLEYLANNFLGHEDASECINDTYMKAWNSIPPERPNNFKAWLLKVCRNLCLDRLDYNNAGKRTAAFVELDDELSECISDPNAESLSDSAELSGIISEFLKKQKKSRRIMFVQRYFYGLSIKEIADQSGLKESNVKVSLLRIRQELAEYLKKEGIEI